MIEYEWDYSMSNNVHLAYARAVRTASKIPGVPTKLVKEWLKPCEWPHTSSRYKRTELYDVHEARVIFGLENPSVDDIRMGIVPSSDAIEALRGFKASKRNPPTSETLEG